MCDNNELDDDIRLSEDTMAILNQFLAEKQAKDENDKMGFEENWQLSQFWYNDKTKNLLASACRKIVQKYFDEDIKIGLFSCPSLMSVFFDSTAMGDIYRNVFLFEYDNRFSIYGNNFVHYDYTKAETANYLEEHTNQFDIIIVDPPFLSEECIDNTAKIIKNVATKNAKIILCSGRKVEQWAKTYLDLLPCMFEPEHERNLGNEFVSYANFNLDEFIES